MLQHRLLPSSILSLLLWPTVAWSCQAPVPLSQLSGIWQGEALTHVRAGVGQSVQRLEMQVSDQGVVKATRAWKSNPSQGGPPGHDAQGNPTYANAEHLLGVFNPNTCRLTLVETDDDGQFSGQLLSRQGKPYLEMEYLQSGRIPVVFHTQLYRQSGNR